MSKIGSLCWRFRWVIYTRGTKRTVNSYWRDFKLLRCSSRSKTKKAGLLNWRLRWGNYTQSTKRSVRTQSANTMRHCKACREKMSSLEPHSKTWSNIWHLNSTSSQWLLNRPLKAGIPLRNSQMFHCRKMLKMHQNTNLCIWTCWFKLRVWAALCTLMKSDCLTRCHRGRVKSSLKTRTEDTNNPWLLRTR